MVQLAHLDIMVDLILHNCSQLMEYAPKQPCLGCVYITLLPSPKRIDYAKTAHQYILVSEPGAHRKIRLAAVLL